MPGRTAPDKAQSTTRPASRRPRSTPANTRPPGLVGYTEPRLFPKPLRPLTRKTTRGFEIIDFADKVLGEPLLEWQKWLVIHAFELLPDGHYRFRTVLVLVARQNGKTHLSRTISLWRLYVDGARLVLGTAQDLGIARESLDAAHDAAKEVPDLAAEILTRRRTNGDEYLKLHGGARYMIRASTRKAGRGLTVDHLTMDEIREQRDWLAWSALSKTIMARADGQIWALTNAGDDQSVVLDQLRAAAGVTLGGDGVSVMGAARDATIGLFEWSAPEGCALDDSEGWCQANPALGVTISEVAIRSAMGTDPPAVFRVEVLCQHVDQVNGAIDLQAWKACADPAGSLAELRDRIVLCLDVAPDGAHVSLVGAAQMPDGRSRLEVFGAWSSPAEARAELADTVTAIGPVRLAWLPAGPAAALGPDIKALEKAVRRMELVELTGADVTAACQELAEQIFARQVVHPADPLLNAHISGAKPYQVGDGWRFVRRGAGHVDAAYGAAGAVHVLRALPAAAPKRKLVV